MVEYTNYKIVVAPSPIALEAIVNEMLNDGWVPTGGLTITQSPFGQNFGDLTAVQTFSHQAMVKIKR